MFLDVYTDCDKVNRCHSFLVICGTTVNSNVWWCNSITQLDPMAKLQFVNFWIKQKQFNYWSINGQHNITDFMKKVCHSKNILEEQWPHGRGRTAITAKSGKPSNTSHLHQIWQLTRWAGYELTGSKLCCNWCILAKWKEQLEGVCRLENCWLQSLTDWQIFWFRILTLVATMHKMPPKIQPVKLPI